MGQHGQGTIVEEASGTYRVAVTMADGRRVYRRVKGKLAAEVMRRALVEMRELDLDPSRLTLADYLRSWLASLRDAKHQRIRDRTLDHYTLIVERHIIPALGRYKLGALSERHIQRWLDADSGAARTVHHHRAVLRRALNVALRQRLIARNPALAVELPDADAFRGSPLTLAEARALLAVGGRLAPLWRLAIDTGLRQGELLGLGWDDIDFDAGTVTVRSQLARRAGAWIRVPTKAARSLERLSLAPETLDALRRHRAAMVAERRPNWQYHGLVFVTADGNPYHGAEVLRLFHAACEAAGVARRRFHDLRGTAATLMRELGVPEDVRMSRLGHSTTAMARHYAKAGADADREAAERLGRALGG